VKHEKYKALNMEKIGKVKSKGETHFKAWKGGRERTKLLEGGDS